MTASCFKQTKCIESSTSSYFLLVVFSKHRASLLLPLFYSAFRKPFTLAKTKKGLVSSKFHSSRSAELVFLTRFSKPKKSVIRFNISFFRELFILGFKLNSLKYILLNKHRKNQNQNKTTQQNKQTKTNKQTS